MNEGTAAETPLGGAVKIWRPRPPDGILHTNYAESCPQFFSIPTVIPSCNKNIDPTAIAFGDPEFFIRYRSLMIG